MPGMSTLLTDLGLDGDKEEEVAEVEVEAEEEEETAPTLKKPSSAGSSSVMQRPSSAGSSSVLKKPSSAGSSSVLKKPASNQAKVPKEEPAADGESEDEPELGALRDRLKARKFERLFDELPDIIKEAWEEVVKYEHRNLYLDRLQDLHIDESGLFHLK